MIAGFLKAGKVNLFIFSALLQVLSAGDQIIHHTMPSSPIHIQVIKTLLKSIMQLLESPAGSPPIKQEQQSTTDSFHGGRPASTTPLSSSMYPY